jgi:porin
MRHETFNEVSMNRTTHETLLDYLPQLFLILLGLLCIAQPVFADETTYSGDIMTRSTLTGDWGGVRNDLAKKGVTFDLDLTQVLQGVAAGGKNSSWGFGGRGDLTLKVDTGKLGLWPGGFLTVELEGNFGQSVNLRNGGLMPVNTNQIFPTPGSDQVNLPALNFAQFFSEYAGVVVGKMDTMSGDMNEFAHGKGASQFMNLAFNINPTLLLTVPYSTLGAGVVILPTKDPNAAIVTVTALSAVGKASSTGFDNLDGNKMSFNIEGRVRTDFFGMTGHQLLGGIYSNKNFKSMDPRLTLAPGTRLTGEKSDSWAVYYNFDQYLYEPVKGSGKGFGVFGRFAATDGNPNFMQYFYSLGLGGTGVAASRPHDSFGIGGYYIDIKSPSLSGPFGDLSKDFLRDEYGFEAYYSLAVTPWALVTPNIQVVRGAQKSKDPLLSNINEIATATILGIRLQVVF